MVSWKRLCASVVISGIAWQLTGAAVAGTVVQGDIDRLKAAQDTLFKSSVDTFSYALQLNSAETKASGLSASGEGSTSNCLLKITALMSDAANVNGIMSLMKVEVLLDEGRADDVALQELANLTSGYDAAMSRKVKLLQAQQVQCLQNPVYAEKGRVAADQMAAISQAIEAVRAKLPAPSED